MILLKKKKFFFSRYLMLSIRILCIVNGITVKALYV